MNLFNLQNNENNQEVINRSKYYHIDEVICIDELLNYASFTKSEEQFSHDIAYYLVDEIRNDSSKPKGIDAFLLQFGLSTEEGTALMCLAEALLRIPDNETRDDLIRDKIGSQNWDKHVGNSESLFVNATTFALMLSGKIISKDELKPNNLLLSIKKIAQISGEPFIRLAIVKAMKILGQQFVLGETLPKALLRAKKWENKGYFYSYDMLGEAAKTDKDAVRYFNSYKNAILDLKDVALKPDVKSNPGISIKLSALEPRYEFAKEKRVFNNLFNKVLELSNLAKKYNIGVTIDAEESERLDISLEIFYKLFEHQDFKNWEGLGLAVQAYQKRAYSVITDLIALAKKNNKKIMIRLVKGAYWDREIKYAQVHGFSDYPVFTKKVNTDVSYLACAKKLFENIKYVYPQFATHNAFTVAAILSFSQTYKTMDFEFQRLHGMGVQLYNNLFNSEKLQIYTNNLHCRIYAPVGVHKDLLSYLVRRLLENGANTSFVNRLIDAKQPIEKLIANPVQIASTDSNKRNINIPLPEDIFINDTIVRKNSKGIDLSNILERQKLASLIGQNDLINTIWEGVSIIAGKKIKNENKVPVYCSYDHNKIIGYHFEANEDDVLNAIDSVTTYQPIFENLGVNKRAEILLHFADLLEKNIEKFITIAIIEAGKTPNNAIGEVREAVDFCRYYAHLALRLFKIEVFQGYTGELDELTLHGKGVFACISPWNFPLAIFLGQITAALITGNTVVAKPAEQTTLIATYAIELLIEAGLPPAAISLIIGEGSKIGKVLISDPRIHGVIFTGSNETAKIINRQLAAKDGPIGTLVAETGGLNAMIVDSSALPEQVVNDVVASAFDSAGQRCSALRILYLQEDVADNMIEMLIGAMQTLEVGNCSDLATDCGPVIDKAALQLLLDHENYLNQNPNAKLLYKVPIDPKVAQQGFYFTPCCYELKKSEVLTHEVFGPILHIVRFKEAELDKVINEINTTGYGLTFGIHSRINEKINYIKNKVKAGNCYVNRNIVGAIVGLQPFGGEGLSGTGPKAGGPHYLLRLCTERTLSFDITAQGGNASLLSLED